MTGFAPAHQVTTGRLAALFGILAWCQVTGAAPGAPILVVVLHSPKQAVQAADLADAISIQASDLPVRVVTRATGGGPGPTPGIGLLEEARAACGFDGCLAAVSWTDLPDGRTLLHTTDPADGRVLTREISAEDREAHFEAMALICRSTLSLLLEGGRIGIVPTAPMTPPAAPAAPPPTTADPGGTRITPPLTIGIGYAFAVRSAEVPAMHGLDLSAGWQPAPDLILWLGYSLFAPAEITGRQAEISVRRHPLSLGADLSFGREGSRWRAGGGFGIVVDVVEQETRRLQDSTTVPRDNRDTLFGLSASLPLTCRISEHLALFARFGVDFFVNNINYIYHNISSDRLMPADPDGDSFERLESPWRVQPRIHLGLSISLP